MIRRLVFETLLFLAPFALYFLYWRVTLARAGETSPSERNHPWNYLFVAGLALVALSFVVLGLTEGSGQRGTYVPPHVENGQVVPGRVVPDADP
jgi:hypothetical protein